MNNIREDIEKIINNHLMKDTAYTLMSNGLKSELETYINKVREEFANTVRLKEKEEVPSKLKDMTNLAVQNYNQAVYESNNLIDKYLQSIKEQDEKNNKIQSLG